MQPAGETIDLTLGGATTSGIATLGSGHSTPGATATPSSFRLKQSQLNWYTLNYVIFQQLHGPMQWAVALLECMLCMEGEKKISVNNVTFRSVEPHEQTHSRVRCPLCMCSTKMH